MDRDFLSDTASGRLSEVEFTFPEPAQGPLALSTFAASSPKGNKCQVENIMLRCEIITAGFVRVSIRLVEVEKKNEDNPWGGQWFHWRTPDMLGSHPLQDEWGLLEGPES
jgi:hypothetical protein